jgi:hypothetical protein
VEKEATGRDVRGKAGKEAEAKGCNHAVQTADDEDKGLGVNLHKENRKQDDSEKADAEGKAKGKGI